jgi:ATP-binding cassette subfamily F protein uup
MTTPLITLTNITLTFSAESLLDQVALQILPGERVCLIGRNGAGKSSLLKIIAQEQTAYSGEIWRKPGLRIARLEQELPQQSNLTVFETVAQGLAEVGKLLADYHEITLRLSKTAAETDLKRLSELQHALDACDGWRYEQLINTTLQRLELNAEQKVAELSGGWQRRVALAKALVAAPDLLLLDEPTNHLDIAAIQWLENELMAFGGGVLFITHDRALLQRLATRIIELDRGNLTSWPGDYANFLRRKEEQLAAEAKHNAEFDKKLAAEERWIRQGIKARRTRNEGRVRALKALRNERAQRREVQGKATLSFKEAEKSGQLVVEAENIRQVYADKVIIDNFSTRIMRGDRIGLIGPNGIGKSTLLNILLGNLAPQQGRVRLGTKLQIAYFDQMRAVLDPEKTVLENVAQGRESIQFGDKTKHIISYLGNFLFTPQRAHTPVKALSGGECNRLVLANLFSKPANLLVLDEPTNDLDIETLELLEELLNDYNGTLLLVSHDRAFLDNVVTSVLVFSGNGKISEYVGGYSDWLQMAAQTKTQDKKVDIKKPKEIAEGKPARQQKKLSYKEQRELAELPQRIEQFEQEQQTLSALIASPKFYQQDNVEITKIMSRLQELETLLQQLYSRWEALE